MRFGFQPTDSASARGRSFDGSFRRSTTGSYSLANVGAFTQNFCIQSVLMWAGGDGLLCRGIYYTAPSPDRRSSISNASRSVSSCKRGFRGLKEYSKTLIDIDTFANSLEDWIFEKTTSNFSSKPSLFKSPFAIDELRRLDYALEGVLFQQLFRMPYSDYASDDLKEDQFLALEDFLQTIMRGLWQTFWQTSGPFPLSVSCPRYPGSRFYTVRKAISNGRLGGLIGEAIAAKSDTCSEVQWDQVLELALFKSDITRGSSAGFSTSTICEALFYGFHILISRTMSSYDALVSSSVYLLVLDPKFGGVIKLAGDLSKLEISSCNPYHCVVEWIKHHAEVSVSPIDRVWNRLGNANWGDVGPLQIILATFNSIVQWKGPPGKSIASLAADHSLRFRKRSIGCNSHHFQQEEDETDCNINHSFKEQDTYIKLRPGEVILLEDSLEPKGFRIKEIVSDENSLSYTVVSLNHPSRLLIMYVAIHQSRLEPSWEAMNLWFNVQRQTKVLNMMKQLGVSSKNLPELISSGRVSHPGNCTKSCSGGKCDHPRCGTAILVTSPVGEAVSSVIGRDGPLSSEEALRCCRDTLTAFKSAAIANIQHGEVCPANIIRVDSPKTAPFYVLLSWGRAVVEDIDSPAMNVQFSSIHALQYRKLCPSSDAESLVYVLYFVCGGSMQQLDSIESAIRWRKRCWAKRCFQQQLGEVSPLLKAFAYYVDSICGTPYPMDYDIWLRRLNRAVDSNDRGKSVETADFSPRLEVAAESSGTSGAGTSC